MIVRHLAAALSTIVACTLVFAWAFACDCKAGVVSGVASQERMQARTSLPGGQRIALWAMDFLGTPYDPDPLGAYVTRRAVVADDEVDCMYHVFRSAELGLSNSLEEAKARALDLRFHANGRLAPDGSVANYDERFQYGEDMIRSGKWGSDITNSLGARLVEIPGSRGIANIQIVPASETGIILPALRDGDIVFLVKDPARRVVGEIVGHMGIIALDNGEVFMVHASGRKSSSAKSTSKSAGVVKIRLIDYARSMPFAGLIVTRF